MLYRFKRKDDNTQGYELNAFACLFIKNIYPVKIYYVFICK